MAVLSITCPGDPPAGFAAEMEERRNARDGRAGRKGGMEHTNGSGTTWERPDAPLGTLVYRAGLLSKEKLESALEEGRQTGRRLGEILLQKGWIEEKDLARLLAGQRGLAFVSLKGRGFDPEIARLLGERVSRFHCALAMEEDGGSVLVAVADPTDGTAVSDIGAELKGDFRLVVATPSEIRKALDEVFADAVAMPVVAPPPPSLTIAPPEPAGSPDFGLRVAPPPGLPEESAPAFFRDSDPVAPAEAPEPDGRPEPDAEGEPEAQHQVQPFALNGAGAASDAPADALRVAPSAEQPARDVPAISMPPLRYMLKPSSPAPEPEPVPLLRLDERPAAPPPAVEASEPNDESHVNAAFDDVAPDAEPQPEPLVFEPEPVVSEPGLVVSEPELVVSERELVVAEPELVVSEPTPVVFEPGLVVSEPELVVSEPEPVASEPELVVSGPELIVSEAGPVVSDRDPVVSVPELVGSDPDPVVSEPQLVGSDPEPVVSDPDPVASEPELVVSGPERVVSDPELVVSNSEPVVSEPDPVVLEPVFASVAPIPVRASVPESAPDDRELPLRIIMVLEGDEELELGCYADEAAAEAAARDLISLIERRDDWPRVDSRFIRPDRILSVDIRERQSWTGSRSRAAWASGS